MSELVARRRIGAHVDDELDRLASEGFLPSGIIGELQSHLE